MTARLLLVGLALSLASRADAGFQAVRLARAEAEAARLRGTWVATGGVRDGTPLTKDELAAVRLTFRGPQDGPFYTFTDLRPLIPDRTAASAHFFVQPWRTPQGFEIWRQYGLRSSFYPGLYERTGDTLRLCADLRFSPDGPPMRTRPTSFAAPAGSGLTLLTLKREK